MKYKNEAAKPNQHKPVVVGHQCVGWNGVDCRNLLGVVFTKDDMHKEAAADLHAFGHKSKFRPVYEEA